ncbi:MULTISPECIES: hypothetical protein [Microbacterium]|uniref:Phage tail protein n=1 Tax=Microbacterium oxydans TaxID=82380 RepID=A0A3S9WIP0_9MICO|nr:MULTISPECIES: hypothetical protein [Microbacterium]AZS39982.1 hypothetical protein CVS54_01300 [Microbacterium oxydans]KKX97190.1 hypothetical protein AAY78_14530 [Microbacterium sp. Ag1]
MATITPVQPIFMSNAVLTIEGDDYAAALTSVKITPTQSAISARGLKPGARWVRYTDPEWTLETVAFQDDADESYYTYLRENRGQEKTFILTPEDGGRTRTVTVTIPAIEIGGAIDTWASFTVQFPVIGDVTTGTLPVGP